MTNTSGSPTLNGGSLFGEAVFHLLRDMVCWTVLSPMIVISGFMLFFSLAMMAANFQEQAIAVADVIHGLLNQYPFLEYFAVEFNDPNPAGGIDLGSEAFQQYIIEIYIRLTLPIVVLGTLLDFIRRDKKNLVSPNSKIMKAGVISLVVITGWLLMFFFGSDPDIRYSGDTLILAFLLSGVMFVVSSVSLLVSHAISGLEFSGGQLSYAGPNSRTVGRVGKGPEAP